MEFFDSHCHLQDPDFDRDRDQVFSRARAAGVAYFMLPASSFADSALGLDIASDQVNCYAAIGVHPHDAKTWSQAGENDLLELYSRAEREADRNGQICKIRAYGEIGLDYYYDHSPRQIQQAVFRRQLELAHQLDLPLIIHEREAFQDTYDLLKQAKLDGLLRDLPGVVHCFSGSVEGARLMVGLGFMLGFDGPITYKNARKSLEVIQAIPQANILIETDAPYLSPQAFRGQRNEPQRIPVIALKVADLLKLSLGQVAELTTTNAKRLFAI